ncbi:MAG TPA: transposase [Pyrinomonadaceae bacterium]|jgi:REP element-mobilizing transposase RayT
MSQSLAKIWTHLIFSTKERYPFLSDETVRHDMHSYLAKVLKANNCPTLLVGGDSDVVLSKNHSIASIVWAIKRSSSKWVKGEGASLRKFHWQEGYGAFSVSQSDVERVERYILNQETHHRRKTFQDEFRGFLKKYQVDYDERYVWD